MKRYGLVLVLVMATSFMSTKPVLAKETQMMSRLYNQNSGEHFYTASAVERQTLIDLGWQDEGEAFEAPVAGIPVFRVYNRKAGDHHYTSSESEKNHLVQLGWQDEGVGWYALASGTPVYRAYNKYATSGSHHYTTSQNEIDLLVKAGWQDEGIAWYAVSSELLNAQPTTREIAISQAVYTQLATYRLEKGKPLLQHETRLDTGAYLRAKEISTFDTSYADQQKLAQHLRPNGQSFASLYQNLAITDFSDYAENIALIPHQESIETSAKLSITNLSNSQQGHREMMETEFFDQVGVGVFETSTQTIVVQHFAKK